MDKLRLKEKWIYGLLLLPVISAIKEKNNNKLIYKTGSDGIGIINLIILKFKKTKQPKDSWLFFGAFLFYRAGDWFMLNKLVFSIMFS